LSRSSRLAGIASGAALPEQWDAGHRPDRFLRREGDLAALLGSGYQFEKPRIRRCIPDAARASVRDRGGRWLGALHPAIVQS